MTEQKEIGLKINRSQMEEGFAKQNEGGEMELLEA